MDKTKGKSGKVGMPFPGMMSKPGAGMPPTMPPGYKKGGKVKKGKKGK